VGRDDIQDDNPAAVAIPPLKNKITDFLTVAAQSRRVVFTATYRCPPRRAVFY